MYNEWLFPGDEARHHVEEVLSARLRASRNTVQHGPVSPTVDMDLFRDTLATKNFETPENMEDVLEWTIAVMEAGLVQPTHPRYFGLFNPAPTFPSACADQIAAAFNPQICVWSHAPVAVEIEKHVIEQVALRAGMPSCSGGHFTSGGSEANKTAVICALTAVDPSFSEGGARALKGKPRIYVSRESHLAWLKIAHELGIGRNAVRLVATDGSGRMSIEELDQLIRNDSSQGDIPVFVAATAGTTNAGVVDPLERCADVTAEHRVWYHVDAAWGGALVASPKYRSVLAGMDKADSITIDAHKWFATTMGAGILLTRKKTILAEAFRVSTDYMPSNDSAIDPYVNSVQWSRRFLGLRLFLSLCVAGWNGYSAHVEHAIDMIRRLTDKLTANGWTLANDSQMAVACLIPPQGESAVGELVRRVVNSGNSWV